MDRKQLDCLRSRFHFTVVTVDCYFWRVRKSSRIDSVDSNHFSSCCTTRKARELLFTDRVNRCSFLFGLPQRDSGRTLAMGYEVVVIVRRRYVALTWTTNIFIHWLPYIAYEQLECEISMENRRSF